MGLFKHVFFDHYILGNFLHKGEVSCVMVGAQHPWNCIIKCLDDNITSPWQDLGNSVLGEFGILYRSICYRVKIESATWIFMGEINV